MSRISICTTIIASHLKTCTFIKFVLSPSYDCLEVFSKLLKNATILRIEVGMFYFRIYFIQINVRLLLLHYIAKFRGKVITDF